MGKGKKSYSCKLSKNLARSIEFYTLFCYHIGSDLAVLTQGNRLLSHTKQGHKNEKQENSDNHHSGTDHMLGGGGSIGGVQRFGCGRRGYQVDRKDGIERQLLHIFMDVIFIASLL